jgi:hypothetical protein
MFDEHDLVALLQAYIAGDVLARKALLDALDEAGDPRMELVRAESIDWEALAVKLVGLSPQAHGYFPAVSHMRWQIDCARYGSSTRDEVAQGVRTARRQWLQQLFPEFDL